MPKTQYTTIDTPGTFKAYGEGFYLESPLGSKYQTLQDSNFKDEDEEEKIKNGKPGILLCLEHQKIHIMNGGFTKIE